MRIPLLRFLLRCPSISHHQTSHKLFYYQHAFIVKASTIPIRPFCIKARQEGTSASNQDTKADVKKIVDYICDKAGVKVGSDQAISVVSYLTNESVPLQHIEDGLRTNPNLLAYPAEKWQRAVAILKNYGFKNNQIIPVLYSHHVLFDGNTEQLYDTGEALRQIGCRDGDLQKLICKDPMVLELTPSDIIHQYNDLRQTFKSGEIVAMALESPSILHEDFSELEKKTEYIHGTMGIDHEVIAECCAIGYPFLKIKARHLFLERAGLYKKPNPKKIINYENPSLSQMLRLSDNRFAKKLASMTEFEYKTFEMMVAIEEAEDKENMSENYHPVSGESHDGSDSESGYIDEDSDDEIDYKRSYKRWRKPQQK